MIGLAFRAAAAVARVVTNPAVRGAVVSGARTVGRAVADTTRAILRTCRRPPNISIGPKIAKQMPKRGWTRDSAEEAVRNPARTVKWHDTRYLPGGGKENSPATGYYHKDGGYVVRNDKTGDIVQVSNRNDPNWIAPWP